MATAPSHPGPRPALWAMAQDQGPWGETPGTRGKVPRAGFKGRFQVSAPAGRDPGIRAGKEEETSKASFEGRDQAQSP